jgi:hypothetical protein
VLSFSEVLVVVDRVGSPVVDGIVATVLLVVQSEYVISDGLKVVL